MEDVITLIKNGTRTPSKEVCTILLQGLDVLKYSVEGLTMDFSFSIDTKEVESAFEAVKNGKISETPISGAKKESPTDALKVLPPSEKEKESIRVNIQKLDTLLNLVGEMVVHQSIITGHRIQGTTASEHAIQTLSYVEKLVLEIQNL